MCLSLARTTLLGRGSFRKGLSQWRWQAGSHAAFCSLLQMIQKQLKKCRNMEQKEKLQQLLNRMVSSVQHLLYCEAVHEKRGCVT